MRKEPEMAPSVLAGTAILVVQYSNPSLLPSFPLPR